LDTFKSFKSKIYEVNGQSFTDIALDIFRFQAFHNEIYNSYITRLRIDPYKVRSLEEIPFLPVSFFKTQTVKTGNWEPTVWFTSTGTTGSSSSKHPIYDMEFYLEHSRRCFEYFFGPLENYHFLALLPSYLERTGSSLIAMMEFFIRQSKSQFSGFYLHETSELLQDVASAGNDHRTTILWGVSFALFDLAEQYDIDLSHCLIFETGGMKGRRRELTRNELHAVLKNKLRVKSVYSEYGMTELFSQAYTSGNQFFSCPPWLKVIGREITDPLRKGLLNETAGINVIDLANWHSVSFIETEDIGKIHKNGTFEVLGRMDNSEVRGCNLLIE
jgi:phenylacetate-coenzyme A ligase PaaK-like adenylate-forming protein